MRLARSLLLVASLAGANLTMALTTEQQADQYLLDAQQAYKDGRYSGAYSAFKNIEGLGVDMVDDFHFFYANAAYKTKNYSKAWQQINLYLNKTQRSGSYYSKALGLYKDIRPQMTKSVDKDISAYSAKIAEFEKLAKKHNLNAVQALQHKRLQKQQMQQLLDQNYFSKASSAAQKQKAALERQMRALEYSVGKRKTVSNLMDEYRGYVDFGILKQADYKTYRNRLAQLGRDYLQRLNFEEYDQKIHRLHVDISPGIRTGRAKEKNIEQAKKAVADDIKLALNCRSWKSQFESLEKIGHKYDSNAQSARRNYKKQCGDK